ncbi:hypothetical protein GOODEAATRI_023273, partial [Goodea atripinnis]
KMTESVKSVGSFKQSSSCCFSRFDIMRPRRYLTIDQQYLTIVKLQTGCSQTEVVTERSVTEYHLQVTTERLEESQKARDVDVFWPHPTDDHFIANRDLQKQMMNCTLQTHLKTLKCHSSPFKTIYLSM